MLKSQTVKLTAVQKKALDQAAAQHKIAPATFARFALALVAEQIALGKLTILDVLKFDDFCGDGGIKEKTVQLTYHDTQLVVINQLIAMLPYSNEFSILQRSAIGYVINLTETTHVDLARLKKYDRIFPKKWLDSTPGCDTVGCGMVYIIVYHWIVRLCQRHYYYTIT